MSDLSNIKLGAPVIVVAGGRRTLGYVTQFDDQPSSRYPIGVKLEARLVVPRRDALTGAICMRGDPIGFCWCDLTGRIAGTEETEVLDATGIDRALATPARCHVIAHAQRVQEGA